MKKLALIVLAAIAFKVSAATVTACSTSDVTLEGSTAISCAGMFEGNVNSLEDVNTALGSSYTEFDSLTTEGNSFSFSDIYSNIIEIVLKQNTHWAVYQFDLSLLNNLDGVWDGTWSTSGMEWDNKPKVAGCQGCGGLSHGAIVGDPISEVPVPGTLGLLGLGLIGLGAIRKQRNAN